MGRNKRSRRHKKHSSRNSSGSESSPERRRRSRVKTPPRTSDSLEKFTSVVTKLLEQSSKRPSGSGYNRGEAVPIFDPEDHSQSSEMWCRQVDELRETYFWSEEDTAHFALTKLKGLAATWYKGLTSVRFTWSEWKVKIQTAFPFTRDFYELLVEMVRRRKRSDETYAKYFYEKAALVNACEITGRKAVSCIIGGLEDRVVKAGARAGRHEDPEALLLYLSQFNDTVPTYTDRKRDKKRDSSKDYRKYSKGKELTCYKCGKPGHFANKCAEVSKDNMRCSLCRGRGHEAKDCAKKVKESTKTIALLEVDSTDTPNRKFYKEILINNQPSTAYVDFGSSCTTITKGEMERLKLKQISEDKITLYGYGKGVTMSIGTVNFNLKVDEVEAKIDAIVVSDVEQAVPVIVGRTFTEIPQVVAVKDSHQLRLLRRENEPDLMQINIDTNESKVILRAIEKVLIPSQHIGMVPVHTADFVGDVYVETSLRPAEGSETCVPRHLLKIREDHCTNVPLINLSEEDAVVKKNQVIARAWPCIEEAIMNVEVVNEPIGTRTDFGLDDIKIGPISKDEKKKLMELLQEYRECISLTTSELGCAKSAKMDIQLTDDKPFAFRPYKMAAVEQGVVKEIIDDLLRNNIISESDSDYASPIVLVTKPCGEKRLCIDYRRLNKMTIKYNYPLPRIDEQIDRLQGGVYFTSLDLKSGYYQIPMGQESKKYTSFVTPTGQYEFERMPFGLTNAPRTFQKYVNKILLPINDIASVYLDDVLLHAQTVPEAFEGLKKVLEIFRSEGITLNLKKCAFLMTTVTFLGYEVSAEGVKPGREKMYAVQNFPAPKSVHNIRQFLGLTSYFRHFIKDFANIAKPLTMLLRKSNQWRWTEEEQNSFDNLKNILTSRPVLALFNPEAETEVHTDASARGLAGVLLQRQADKRLHPIAYYSRQTNEAESRYHSYELETLAVVDTLKKFRSYLLGITFTVVTDCNSLQATNEKKEIIPRIARWWLQLQEFTFNVKYRPGNRLKHVDALSRNLAPEMNEGVVMRITQADWVLSAQLTDKKITNIHEILTKPPQTEKEKQVYKNYALRDGRVYRITAKGIQWVVPTGMRYQVVKSAHDDLGHFGIEKTLGRLCEHYWFPRMKAYIEKYIACCIKCLYNKRNFGKKEGLLHPIARGTEPMKILHIDHLGPFPKSKRGNQHLIVVIDGFTKFLFLQATKTTKTKNVVDFLLDICSTYGTPLTIITDQGSSFTSKKFGEFCRQNNIKHVKNAVATPRANGQVERLNRSILSVLMTADLEEDNWDLYVRQTKFAINSHTNKSTGKSPSQLLFGYQPRGGTDVLLTDELAKASNSIQELVDDRRMAAENIMKAQERQKHYFDKKRKVARKYKAGDMVLIEKTELAPNVSRKLLAPFSGPFIVKSVLPHDRYVVTEMQGSHRTARKANYERVIAADRMRPWVPPGGLSDDTDEASGSDGVAVSSDDTTDELETSLSQDGRL